ncbi:hypothetical protein FBU59_002075, partial [Linderina macrospora]
MGQVSAGPIASIGNLITYTPILVDANPTNNELASLGGLLQALGAGVIGNGALIYPTGPTSHQRAEAEIVASDSATRILKKVKSAIKDGGLNEDDSGDGDDNHKSVTYLVKPALIFHKEEIPPPNPLAGNVMPLPGGALLYTPTPTVGTNGQPTNGALANIKAAYGNLFAASPYTPSYTLNQPHAAVIVEEVTDILSLKSSLRRLEDDGEDVNDSDDDDEDEYGRKHRGRKSVEIVMLETIESTTSVVNPFTRPDFPFGLMTPPTPAAVPATSSAASKKGKHKDEEGEGEGDEDVSVTHKGERKTIRRTVNIKTTSTVPATSSGTQLSASVGKDGSITIVGNIPSPSTSTPAPNAATTIVVPGSAARTQASSS